MKQESDKREKKYPVGIQSFREIIEGGYLYVDKSEYIYELTKGKYYFLSRPRRFGKSLLLSTMDAYYTGRKELFKGLALESLTDDWEPHPVLHLDLNTREYRNRKSLEDELNAHLERWESEYADSKPDRSPEERFSRVIRGAYEKTGKKVVILIDEYDKPLLYAINNESLAEEYRSLLKAFHANLKTMDPYIEIAFLTGVARFSKVSIFSDLNNVRDISFEEQFSGICGITTEEVDKYFIQGIQELARKEGTTPEEMRNRLKKNYDGYHFCEKSPDIYNPFSLVSVFAKMELGSYWFEWGTPTYLVKLIESEGWTLRDLSPVEVDALVLQTSGLFCHNPIPVLYQTGYLTIKDYDSVFRTYTLAYPNEEVREGFLSYLIPYYIHPNGEKGTFSIKKFVTLINKGDIKGFMDLLGNMIAGIPYSEKGSAEDHFQNAAYLLFTLMGQFVKVEDRTSDGRIDLTLETREAVYIFEFKIDSTVKEAMAQILGKKYWLKYIPTGKQINLIGCNFDSKTKRLENYEILEP